MEATVAGTQTTAGTLEKPVAEESLTAAGKAGNRRDTTNETTAV